MSSIDNQEVLNSLTSTAKLLGLSFNYSKCCNLSFRKGKPTILQFSINGSAIHSLVPYEHEDYLGLPIGTKTLYRPPSVLIPFLRGFPNKRGFPNTSSALIMPPSCILSLQQRSTQSLDVECRKFLKSITDLPAQFTDAFFYADMRIGGLGTFRLTDADIWKVARATQLL